jgi:sucrose-6-phosphate hydrolase SacC (GH32 family)
VTDERFRPGYHFSARRNWLNDPNGLVWYDGEYHLFYQHNPYGTDWGHMSWGHAVSADLVHWTELPPALLATDDEHVFSGSVVVDRRNTSGLAIDDRPAMVAVYTSADPVTGQQAQGLAVSHDRGRTWTRYDGNPVLDVGSTDFRDPKVFWYEPGDCWVMVVALAADQVVQFYASDDLMNWRHLSDFGPAGASSGLWECPDLFPLAVEGQTVWVLVVSVDTGAVAGGSGTQYFLGDFDGKTFVVQDPGHDGEVGIAPATWLDFGADYYAAVSYGDTPDGERVLIGWMSNWDYAAATPTEAFRGSMSFPRVHRLARVAGRLVLTQRPVRALESLRGDSFEYGRLELNDEAHELPHSYGDQLEIRASFKPGTAQTFGIRLRGTKVGYDVANGSLYLDRTQSGHVDLHPDFAGVHRAPLGLHDGRVVLRLLVDVASVEVFGGIGEAVITDQIFPQSGNHGIELFAEDGTVHVEELRVTTLSALL